MVKRPKVVIDTNIVISAQRSRQGASARLISLIGTGLFEVHISIPLILEYEEVLTRNRATLGLSQDDVEDLVDAFCALSKHHERIHFRWRPFLPDQKDEFILDLAVAAQSDYIITYNQKDFAGVEQFGIKVSDPKTFLQAIGVIL
ncbi:MAG: putative toxin-antitoxin system toxin component, PIN family [Anaerolineae bacterium]|nr:putative toxin-antitoxin system toxin component, PIN family [Anaerolineae bacterium]